MLTQLVRAFIEELRACQSSSTMAIKYRPSLLSSQLPWSVISSVVCCPLLTPPNRSLLKAKSTPGVCVFLLAVVAVVDSPLSPAPQ